MTKERWDEIAQSYELYFQDEKSWKEFLAGVKLEEAKPFFEMMLEVKNEKVQNVIKFYNDIN